ncbi:NACHT domain-containing protein [Candidatus Poribacteria bacterium]|nr:NACHT domain-containing protein [Candidatus Poribacteria bacterium]MYB01518.1 NACHT domain-containing protein [Candidatus Poribacteria bacterium]
MLEKIGTGILTKAVSGFLKDIWERVKNRHQNSKNASHDYNTPYKKRHGQLQVFCVGMEAQRSVDDVYVVVQFLTKRKATKHNSTEDVGKVFLQKGRGYFTSTSDERQDGMRAATNEQYLMVLGVPGVGKSTFLRKIGLEALKGEDGNLEHQCIPVFLELRRFTKDPIDIEAWIINEFKICGHPYPEQWANSKLKSGELLILFDGLDEVPKPNVNNVINKIRDFVHQYSQNRFIASCRIGAYKGEFTDFTVVEITDFDDSQIEMYINNWFASVTNRKMKTAQRCWQALNDPERQAIKALAQNPLSLALLCQVYEDSQDFPSTQAILYEKILNIFLKKWTAEKHVSRDLPVGPYLAISTVKELLSEIAARNFKEDRLVFSEDELIDQIQEFYQRRTDISSGFDASEILDAILVDPGLFVERANGVYTFFHLTFQEYLTANHIVGDTPSIQHPVNQHLYYWRWEKVLLLTDSIQDMVNQHLYHPLWREVFLFTAGLMREADLLLLAMEVEAVEYIHSHELEGLLRWA